MTFWGRKTHFLVKCNLIIYDLFTDLKNNFYCALTALKVIYIHILNQNLDNKISINMYSNGTPYKIDCIKAHKLTAVQFTFSVWKVTVLLVWIVEYLPWYFILLSVWIDLKGLCPAVGPPSQRAHLTVHSHTKTTLSLQCWSVNLDL